MKALDEQIKSVAIIGAGAAGAVTAAAFKSEYYFLKICIFERRETAGGTWIYDPAPAKSLPIPPSLLPPSIDRRSLFLEIFLEPRGMFIKRDFHRHLSIPLLHSTDLPSIAMSFSDLPFAYGPFVPHHIPKEYIESYIPHHKLDSLLTLNATVEDVSKLCNYKSGFEKWKLTLRRYDPLRNVDEWWEDIFDAVILANGHYSVPFIPEVKGLDKYMKIFPTESSTPKPTGHHNSTPIKQFSQLVRVHQDMISQPSSYPQLIPVFQSRRTPSRWDGDEPPKGIAWKPVISEFLPSGRIVFQDGTWLEDIDVVIYCTGYLPSPILELQNKRKGSLVLREKQTTKFLPSYLLPRFQQPSNRRITASPHIQKF